MRFAPATLLQARHRRRWLGSGTAPEARETILVPPVRADAGAD